MRARALDVERLADEADVIVGGYAMVRDGDGYRVDNLNVPGHAACFDAECRLLCTNMDDIEAVTAANRLRSALKYMSE